MRIDKTKDIIISSWNRYRKLYSVGFICLFFLMCILTSFKFLERSNIPFLYDIGEAKWIRFPEPTKLKVQREQSLITFFRTTFKFEEPLNEAVLHFRAMKVVEIELNGQIIHKMDMSHADEWKKERRVNIVTMLAHGSNELKISVWNNNGHPALLAYCEHLKIFTGKNWEASKDELSWQKALPLDETPPLSFSRTFQRADKAFLQNLFLFIPIFSLVFMFIWISEKPIRPPWMNRFMISAAQFRFIVILLWIVLAINNIAKIPLDAGMDIKGHMQYVMFIYEDFRIPFANDGWQTFQAPLFYVLSAFLYKFLSIFFSIETSQILLRILPLFCGIVQVEICYRTMKYVYPDRNDLQSIGTVIGGFLPMNIYMSQFIGNEPLAALFSSAATFFIFKILSSHGSPSKRDLFYTGLFLGFALLTKISALVLALPIAVCLLCKIIASDWDKKTTFKASAQMMFFVFGVSFVISGWYYIRNWIEMGHFFIAGWDSSRNIVWWQDPGYRTPSQLYAFGESLFYPVYSALASFWDGLYSTLWMDGYLSAYNRPPWNYGFMLSGAWLSLLPSAAIITGIISSLSEISKEIQRNLIFASFTLTIYILAIFYIYLSVPVISSAKASYALGLTPCIAVLFAGGFDAFTRRFLFIKAALYGIFACWAVSAYAAYFVIQ